MAISANVEICLLACPLPALFILYLRMCLSCLYPAALLCRDLSFHLCFWLPETLTQIHRLLGPVLQAMCAGSTLLAPPQFPSPAFWPIYSSLEFYTIYK